MEVLEDSILTNKNNMEKCKICGEPIEAENYIRSTSDAMKEHHMCFFCNLWRERIEEDKKLPPHTACMIDGTHYIIGPENDDSPFRGFGGSKFQIEFNDGHRVVTTNLWCQGETHHPYWREKFPDNARFENNLKWKKIGECNYLVEDDSKRSNL